jgi:hypothetical protein
MQGSLLENPPAAAETSREYTDLRVVVFVIEMYVAYLTRYSTQTRFGSVRITVKDSMTTGECAGVGATVGFGELAGVGGSVFDGRTDG